MLKQTGHSDLIGPGEPLGAMNDEEGEEEEVRMADAEGEGEEDEEEGDDVEDEAAEEGVSGGGSKKTAKSDDPLGRRLGRGRRGGSDRSGDGDGSGSEDLHDGSAPEGYSEASAMGALGALRQFSKNWLVLLFKVRMDVVMVSRFTYRSDVHKSVLYLASSFLYAHHPPTHTHSHPTSLPTQVFLDQPPEARGPTASAISACCALTDPSVLGPLFR